MSKVAEKTNHAHQAAQRRLATFARMNNVDEDEYTHCRVRLLLYADTRPAVFDPPVEVFEYVSNLFQMQPDVIDLLYHIDRRTLSTFYARLGRVDRCHKLFLEAQAV